uniref:Uncharacterized protein n=1 Tax=Chrysotila carterae TaxID=13221 RepID=A0A7S4B7U8_CHRCT
MGLGPRPFLPVLLHAWEGALWRWGTLRLYGDCVFSATEDSIRRGGSVRGTRPQQPPHFREVDGDGHKERGYLWHASCVAMLPFNFMELGLRVLDMYRQQVPQCTFSGRSEMAPVWRTIVGKQRAGAHGHGVLSTTVCLCS